MRASTQANERDQLLRWATNASVATAIGLGLCKVEGGGQSGSVTVRA